MFENKVGGGWNTWKGTDVNPAYKAELAKIQRKMEAKIKAAIDANKAKNK